MVTVFVKPAKQADEYYFNLSNGWFRKDSKQEALKLLLFYLCSPEYRVFIDDFTDALLKVAVETVSAEGFTKEQIVSNLKNYQFNKYLCSILKSIEK